MRRWLCSARLAPALPVAAVIALVFAACGGNDGNEEEDEDCCLPSLSVFVDAPAGAGGLAEARAWLLEDGTCEAFFYAPGATEAEPLALGELTFVDREDQTWTWTVPPGTPAGEGEVRVECEGGERQEAAVIIE